MRLPTLSRDFWQLLSAEERHAVSPATFEIPAIGVREALQIGDGVKLIFEIEGQEEDDDVTLSIERMWVVVTHCLHGGYIGVLVNHPCSISTKEDFYLGYGCEVPFLPMHVASIERPPADYVVETLSRGPSRRWQDLD